jgi:hypothetical protein
MEDTSFQQAIDSELDSPQNRIRSGNDIALTVSVPVPIPQVTIQVENVRRKMKSRKT